MARVTVEDCIEKVPNRFGLVLLAGNRARAIANGAPLTLALPLAEFAKAYDGPPTDPKQFEENQKKLQEELQKKAEEQRKKLEGAGGANPAAK